MGHKNFWVVVTGDFGEGLKGVYGLFDSQEKAELFADEHNLGHWTKIPYQIEFLDEEEGGMWLP
jgi:hypothetical protein